ncbi:hypothetical protein GGU11DRAFT_878935 [Lentinula aff. detonsa]|nr:hypothetical protein GGU11DRAFT_878935 [Lentinula aff. detonsa]
MFFCQVIVGAVGDSIGFNKTHVDSAGNTIANNISAVNIRPHGVTLSTASNWPWNTIIAMITPYMVDSDKGNLQSNVFWVSLEQVDQMMAETTPRTSANWRPTKTFALEMGMTGDHKGSKVDITSLWTMTFNISTDKAYTGLLKAITEDQQVNAADILDNLEENQDNIDLDLNHNQSSFDLLGLKEAVKEVSKGVSEKTSQEYLRHMIAEGNPFFCTTPHPQAAVYLVAWIMHSCDSINLDGSPINTNVEQSTYTHAQKMRAAATFGFGRIHSLGMQAWHQSEISGQMLGNPSVSETTHAGETSTSARAVTSELLAELHHFNNQPEFRESHVHWSSSRKAPKGQLGPRARTMLNLGYNLAFCGLLRVDELLKIQMQDVTISDIAKTGKTKLILRLPFRKTSQFGDIKPFVWYEMPEQYQHICVVRAFARWILISELKEGYLFRKIRANDRLAEENEPMTSEQFLEMFRNNLLDIGVDFVPYGTHSFRRGGCQWLSVERRWPLRQICEWGGWSQEFTHLTIRIINSGWNTGRIIKLLVSVTKPSIFPSWNALF